jgi:hypothetical protein
MMRSCPTLVVLGFAHGDVRGLTCFAAAALEVFNLVMPLRDVAGCQSCGDPGVLFVSPPAVAGIAFTDPTFPGGSMWCPLF